MCVEHVVCCVFHWDLRKLFARRVVNTFIVYKTYAEQERGVGYISVPRVS